MDHAVSRWLAVALIVTGELAVRPTPWSVPPDGFHFEAVEQTDDYLPWVTPAVGAGRCRFTVGPGRKRCGAPAVATLMRGSRDRKRPWDYCADHLYGRWIEDGKVMGWRLVEDDS